MTPVEQRRLDEALEWVRRIDDPDFADWDGHVRWLEADPANATALDTASSLVARAADGLVAANVAVPATMPVNDNAAQSARRQWRLPAGLGLAAAASIAAMTVAPSLRSITSQSYAVATMPGQQRGIRLADGTRVSLNGDSRITIDRGDPRSVKIDRGEALFDVVHDAAHPFSVQAGDAVFQDVGTAFNVIRNGSSTEVAVREGAVMFDPAGAAVRLERGQSLSIANGAASVRSVAATTVGGWTQGQLSYADASLATVAQDIARCIGETVTVDRSIANNRFNGVVVIEADRARLFRRLSAVAGVSARRDGSGWRLASPTQ